MDYDRAYRDQATYFGAEPNPFLLDHLDAITPGGRVLDVGVGQGRNALAVAERGFQVVGIDPFAAAIETTGIRAAELGLAVELRQSSFSDYAAGAEPFDAVLLFGLLQELTPDDQQLLWRQLEGWTAPGAVLFLTAWHVGDPRYQQHLKSSTRIGADSFRTADGRIRTYLRPGQILELLPWWQPLHHQETLGPWHRHGHSEPERHGLIELVARRISGS